MNEKRDALSALILATLVAIDSTFRVDDRIRDVVLRGGSVDKIREVMGNTNGEIRYATVMPVATAYSRDPAKVSISEESLEKANRFRVEVWYEYHDHDTASLASQATWDTLIEGASGVYTVTNTTNVLTGGYALDIPQQLTYDLVDLTDSLQIVCHKASFEVDVT